MFVALKKIICYNKNHFITHKIYWEKRGDFMKQKNEKGITLVALVVTIIILLILLSVATLTVINPEIYNALKASIINLFN